ncbi:MAG: hypothetical protein EOO78_00960 [Oxalobacteraceae bacterium]|nr:MAG: hypothetical protein EOO78_00960 [Oxalobacteraceae bacterium]
MLLIASGAYVESELAAEFGRIPPAFLPVGNRRLYTYQIGQFGRLHERVCLTVPDDFRLDEADTLWLREHRVDVLRTTPGAALGAAVREFLEVVPPTGAAGPLDVLYGDTLITDPLREGSDWLAVGHTDEYYDWYQEAPSSGQPGGTWTGLFSFADAGLLRTQLETTDDFIAAVRAYDRAVGGLAHWTVSRWLDFGHVHTYFDSKRIITTQRHFNQLRVADGVVTKSGSDSAKIMAEASWFEQAPAQIKPYLAPYICRTTANDGNGGACAYQLEYLHLAALNELYVFGRLPERVWHRIFRAGRVKMVDPRGTDALGRPARFGDLRYDLGKLAHSVLGLYDFIVAGFYLLRVEGQALQFRVLSERCLAVQRLFAATSFAGQRPAQWQCHPAMVLLFLSMLPLHADDPRRQQALMANGIRLYLEWKSDDRHPDGGPEPALP